MRVCGIRLLILCFLLPALSEARTLRIGVETNSPPLSFVNEQNQPDGFSAALFQAMNQTGKVHIEIVPDYWTPNLRAFTDGELDGLGNVTITQERRATMEFSIAHAYVHGVAYYRKGQRKISHTEQLAGKTIGTLQGSIAHTNAVAHGGWGATIVPFYTWQEVLDATREGRVDAALSIRNPASFETVDVEGLKWGFVDDILHQYHIAVRKGDAEALAQINEALAEIRSNGTFDRIYSKWIGPLEPHPIRLADLRPYYLPSAIILLAVAGFILWQLHMLKRLKINAEKLRESEERWKFALEGSGDGIWDWNARTGLVHRSKRWKEMLGYRDDEIGSGLNEWIDRVHPDDMPAVEAMRQKHESGATQTFSVEHRLRCKDGSWKWVLNRGMVVSRDENGQPQRVIGTHTDLTAAKQAEADRLILGKLESTGVLAGGIAHDFNNLLTAILLNLDLARHHKDSATVMLPRIQAAEKAALAARNLTQQLITFSRGGASIVQVTDVRALLFESLPLVLSGSTVRVDMTITPDLWPAEVDGGQIGQVFRNLILNAREAMPRGGMIYLNAVNVSLPEGAVVGLPAGNYLKISVKDEGEGIAPDILEKIFDPYFSTKQRGPQKGMGLGLTICHSIVKKHNGVITAESELGKGATFHVYLPAKCESQPQNSTESTPPIPGAGPKGKRILVMDDEPVMLESLSLALHRMGYDVVETPEGALAVKLYQEALAGGRRFDLVLLDLTIPGGLGGCEALKAIHAIDPDAKAVVMSGYTDSEVMRDPKSAGFQGALLKPFTGEALTKLINRLL